MIQFDGTLNLSNDEIFVTLLRDSPNYALVGILPVKTAGTWGAEINGCRGDIDADRAGYLVEFDQTNDLFTNPANELTEQNITGRFG